jgi:hypothetical protein
MIGSSISTEGMIVAEVLMSSSDDDYADGGSSSDDDTIYDTHTQEGSHVELGPILVHMVCFLSTLFHFSSAVSFY